MCDPWRGPAGLERDNVRDKPVKRQSKTSYAWLHDKSDPQAPEMGFIIMLIGMMSIASLLEPRPGDALLLEIGAALVALGIWIARSNLHQLARWTFGYRDDLVPMLAGTWWHRLLLVLLVFGLPAHWLLAVSGFNQPGTFATAATVLLTILALNVYHRGVLYIAFGPR